jgi:hypothetical protein
LLLPLRGTDFVEPAAIACSALAVILAMLMFRALIRTYTDSTVRADLVTAAAFLGTPAWHYGRTLFTEPYLLLFATAAYSVSLRGRSPLLAGVLLSLGVMMKPPFILLAGPLLIMLVLERRFRGAVLLILPLLMATLAMLWYDAALLGAPLRSVQDWLQGSFIRGAGGILFSKQWGLLITAPALLVALIAWPAFYRLHRRDALVLLAAVAIYAALFANYQNWNGATSYSIRYLVPVGPLFFVSLVALDGTAWWRSYAFRGVTVALCLLSVLINGSAAIQYWKSWDTNLIYATLTAK